MSYTYEKISGNKAKLSFTVPAEEFDAALQKAYLKMRGRVQIPGFRKGKAPRRMIENLYGEGVFYDDALEIVFPDAYQEAVKAEDLQVVDQPSVDVQQIGAGQDLLFTAEVFVKPDVLLGEYKNLTVEVDKKAEVTDEQVDARIESDRQAASAVTDVTDRPVQKDDNVNLDYAGTVDGVAFEGGTAQDQQLVIGSGSFIPGFEEQMIGMAIGEEKDLNVTFPAEYHAKELAGKEAVFHVKVNGIKATELPALDDDFAGDKGYDNVDAYKAAVREELQKNADRAYDVAVENALVEKAADNAEIDIPKAMVDDQIDYMLREMEMNMAYQGLTMDMFLKYTGQTREQLGEGYRQEAEKRVRVELTLEAIRKAEGVEPTEDEIKAQIEEQAKRMGQPAEDFEKGLTEQQRGYLKDSAAVQKTVDLMKASATVKDKEEEKPEEKTEEKPAAEKPKARRTRKPKAAAEAPAEETGDAE